MSDDDSALSQKIDPAAYAAELYARRREAAPVPCEPAPEAKRAMCHENVKAYIAANPGTERVTGWLIMGSEGGPCSFFSHSVVKTANGKLIDITPLGDDRLRLKFLPDNSPGFFALIEQHKPSLEYWPND